MSLKSLYASKPEFVHIPAAAIIPPDPSSLSDGTSLKQLYSVQSDVQNNGITFISYDSKNFKKPSNKKPKYIFPSYVKK